MVSNGKRPAGDKPRIAFIGLGVMGSPMAGHLAKVGYEVTVHNRTPAKAESWVQRHGGLMAKSPAEAAGGADVMLSSLGSDDDVRAVSLGETGAFAAMREGAVYVDHTTTSGRLARELSQEATKIGIAFLDAPLSGGQFGAEKGTLTILVGGDEKALGTVKPVMETYAQALYFMGPAGAGQTTKMVNQILIAGIVRGIAEGLHFAICAGLDLEHTIEVLRKCTGHSWQMDHRAHNMVKGKFDYGFAVQNIHKDLHLCLEEAEQNGAQLPVTAEIDRNFEALIDKGMGDLDSSSLIRLL